MFASFLEARGVPGAYSAFPVGVGTWPGGVGRPRRISQAEECAFVLIAWGTTQGLPGGARQQGVGLGRPRGPGRPPPSAKSWLVLSRGPLPPDWQLVGVTEEGISCPDLANRGTVQGEDADTRIKLLIASGVE